MRYTHYDNELDRYVVPCLYKLDGDQITFMIKSGRVEAYNGQVINRDPDIVFGEVIDRLAELENEEARTARRLQGYQLDHLQMVAELLRRHGVTPEDLHDLKDNFQRAFNILHAEEERMRKAEIDRALQNFQPCNLPDTDAFRDIFPDIKLEKEEQSRAT